MDDKVMKKVEEAYGTYSEKCQKVIALAGKLGLEKVSNLTHLEFNIGSATKTLKLAEGFLSMAKEALLANRKDEAKDLANKATSSLAGIAEFECEQKTNLEKEIHDFLDNLVSPEEKEALAKGTECENNADKAGESLNAGDFENAIKNAKEAKDLLKFIKDDNQKKELEAHLNNVIDAAAKALVSARIARANSLAASQPDEAKQELEKARLLCDSVTDKARCLEQVSAAEKPLKLAELNALIKQSRDTTSNHAATGEQLNQAKAILENAAKIADDVREEPKKKEVADLKADVEKRLFAITVNTTLKKDVFDTCVYFSGELNKALEAIPILEGKEPSKKQDRENLIDSRVKSITDSLAKVRAIMENVILHYSSDIEKKNNIKDLLKDKLNNTRIDLKRELLPATLNITKFSVKLFPKSNEDKVNYRYYMLGRVIARLIEEIEKQ
jgi:hypothetical protein